MKNETSSSSSTVPVLLERVRQMLDDQDVSGAWNLLNNSGQGGQAMQNAKGVCLMRMGKSDLALKILRETVFSQGPYAIPKNTPTVYQSNYVTAMLLQNNVLVAHTLLKDIPDQNHPAVRRLKQAVKNWKRSLPLWRRLVLWTGAFPDQAVKLDFPPGDL
jgi:hypothetical protein